MDICDVAHLESAEKSEVGAEFSAAAHNGRVGALSLADGTTRMRDGLIYAARDFEVDGTHPSESGRQKVAELLLTFFQTDLRSRCFKDTGPLRRILQFRFETRGVAEPDLPLTLRRLHRDLTWINLGRVNGRSAEATRPQ
jgi:hypothetical protein